LVGTEHLPADVDQQWYEVSASQWSIVNGQNSPFTTHHSPPYSYGDSAGILCPQERRQAPDFPFNRSMMIMCRASVLRSTVVASHSSAFRTLLSIELKNQIGDKCTQQLLKNY